MHRFNRYWLQTLFATVSLVALILFALSFRRQLEVTVTLNDDGTLILNQEKVTAHEYRSRVDSDLSWRNVWFRETSVVLTAQSRNYSAARMQEILTHLKSSGIEKINLRVP